MKNNRALRWIYIKTALASAIIALVVALRLDLGWGSAFAAGSFIGLVNWYLLGSILLAYTSRRIGTVLMLAGGKVLLLGSLLAIIPFYHENLAAFFCGFIMFLLMAVLEAIGAMVSSYLQKTPGPRPLPRDWRALILGSSPDA